MAKARKRRSSSRKGKGGSPLVTILLIVGLIVVAVYYQFTGNDPLGLFEPVDPTPPQIIAGEDWWQVQFTNPIRDDPPASLAGTVGQNLIERIDAAQTSIDIAAFEFNLTPVAEALIAARQRGVTIRWVTDDEHGLEADEEDGLDLFPMLEAAGIAVRADDRGALMHNKFWIFDRQTVWTGSTNITENGIFRNNNNVIVLQSPEVAAIYQREFDEMWNGEFGPTSPSTVGQQRLQINETPIQIYFAAEDEVVSHLVPLVEAAERSIRVMAFSFTHDSLGEALAAQFEAGLDVQGIFETRGSETEYSELPRLYCLGAPVRQDGNPRTFHHKVIVIDERVLVTGSLNFSNNADDSNDENVVVITDPTIATEYLQEFDRRWAEAEEPDPADIVCN